MTRVLLATSNGTGMGHLTRQAAVGLALGGEHRPTLFSLSVGLPLAVGLGLEGEYVPSYHSPFIAARAWNGYLRDRLLAIIEETGSEVVLFDGVAAYPGIGQASSTRRDVAFIWLRRGMWKREASTKQIRRSGYFDTVIEPRDLAGDADVGPTAHERDVTRVAPISLVEVVEALPRAEARRALGLPPDGEVALLTLGSGRLGDVAGPGQVAITTLLESSNHHVAVTRPAVARNEVPDAAAERVTLIRDVYPLARYLGAFDLAISSAGYNAAHELVPSGIPTLFVANTSTRTDDQETRSRRLAELGLGLFATDTDPARVGSEARRLFDPSLRDEISARASATRNEITGASETARFITDFVPGFTPRRPSLSVALAERSQRAKDAIKEVLGDKRTEQLKRLLGRQPSPVGQRSEVRIADQLTAEADGPLPLLLTSELTEETMRAELPVEHILPGTSQAYRERRLDLIHNYYDVVE